MSLRPLTGFRIVTLAPNVPGPVAAGRLREFGASVVKVESPSGDPLRDFNPAWYAELTWRQQIVTLDLKTGDGRRKLGEHLTSADLLLTSSRPAALTRLGLSWEGLRSSYPHLSQVAIVGYPSPRENEPGHDLTYLARHGLLTPPHLPRTLLADLAGAERAVSAAIGLLLGRERGMRPDYVEVALSDAAEAFSTPFANGLTKPGAPLGGGFDGYGIYRSSDGWLAVAALEPHFLEKLVAELGLEEPSREAFEQAFSEKTSEEWEVWSKDRDLPIVSIREP